MRRRWWCAVLVALLAVACSGGDADEQAWCDLATSDSALTSGDTAAVGTGSLSYDDVIAQRENLNLQVLVRSVDHFQEILPEMRELSGDFVPEVTPLLIDRLSIRIEEFVNDPAWPTAGLASDFWDGAVADFAQLGGIIDTTCSS